MNRKELEALSRVELQALAKERGIRANLKNDKIIQELLDADADDDQSEAEDSKPPPKAIVSRSRSRVASGSRSRAHPRPTSRSKVRSEDLSEASGKRATRSAKSTAAAKKKVVPATPESSDEDENDDASLSSPPPVHPPRASRPSLDSVPYIDISPRVRPSVSSAPLNQNPTPTSGQHGNAPGPSPLRQKQAISSTSSQASPTQDEPAPIASTSTSSAIYPTQPSPDLKTLFSQFSSSPEFVAVRSSFESSLDTLKASLDMERSRVDQLQRELQQERETAKTRAEEIANIKSEVAARPAGSEGGDQSIIHELELRLATSIRETDGLMDSHKATVKALETYARSLEDRIKNLESQKVVEKSFATPRVPVHLGKRDRVETPKDAAAEGEILNTPSTMPNPSKKARISVMSESSEEASLVDSSLVQDLAEDFEEERALAEMAQPGPSSQPPQIDSSDALSPSRATFISDLLKPPQQQDAASLAPPPSHIVTQLALVPPVRGVRSGQPPLAELPHPLTPMKHAPTHLPLPSVSATSISSETDPAKSMATAPSRRSGTSRSRLWGNVSRRNPPSHTSPSTPAKLVRTSAVSFGQGLAYGPLGTPQGSSTPASRAGAGSAEINVQSPLIEHDPTANPFASIMARPASSFRAPSFTFGGQLGLAISNASTNDGSSGSGAGAGPSEQRPLAPPSPAFSIDAGPRPSDLDDDPFGFGSAGNMDMSLEQSPPPPSPAKRTMYGTEIDANGEAIRPAFGGITPGSIFPQLQRQAEEGGNPAPAPSSPSKYGLDDPNSWGAPPKRYQ